MLVHELLPLSKIGIWPKAPELIYMYNRGKIFCGSDGHFFACERKVMPCWLARLFASPILCPLFLDLAPAGAAAPPAPTGCLVAPIPRFVTGVSSRDDTLGFMPDPLDLVSPGLDALLVEGEGAR